MSGVRMWTPREVEVTEVIRVVAARGDGTDADPIRNVTQFWSFDGKLLAENDPYIARVDPRLE